MTKQQIQQMKDLGISAETLKKQIDSFRKGFPWLEIVAPATPQRGIRVPSSEEIEEDLKYCDDAEISGKCKFVPASGAASRMFKDLFSGLDKAKSGEDISGTPAGRFVENISSFAFYDKALFDGKDSVDTLSRTLSDEGLSYGSKPKGVLKFHKYPDGEVRTAIAEHLVEAQEYMRNPDGTANLVVTISPEHRELFEKALAEVQPEYERRYGVKYNVTFTYQDKATDTVAVDMENQPFLNADGSLLFRPAGHGALIHNLNNLEEELVSIKNIDNVACERMLPVTARYKKVLMGEALRLRDRIFGYIYALDQIASSQIVNPYPSFLQAYEAVQEDVYASDEVQQLCNEIETFLYEELCIEMPLSKDCKERAISLREKLDRPIRVCGMVRNEGEPGGGPFIIREKDGSTSLQILEGAQIDKDNPHSARALASATHFNPVDLVCCLRNSRGEKFNLLDFVDSETGFISRKSSQGKELKALELPGLWNGAMSRWNTIFVEVPLETFNPVKTVLDLLRPAHQA
ncbi:MAG: DUF4301 family protein [Bacteroidales bacterium]|nr:DUF4301 family protein [Candidatus Cacconaster merdequi]